ncbi:hypothetical protein K9U40_07620 [Xanthobacter autotrophicus]|uniref:hypothetical protein n=1 Tax=Xanthobacter TaxID=279 RepID=UPI0024AC492C|nr:hypothetical protein [Xanthobacter autotrophicus]MDI4664200.1 hypothetical protein [Xanthobacter autotrophicus]
MTLVATPPAGPGPKPLHRRITPPRAGGRGLLRAASAGLLLCALAACASEEGLPGLTPPHTNVAPVADNTFPTIGTAAASKRPPLTPEAQQKLQRDLERLAKDQGK